LWLRLQDRLECLRNETGIDIGMVEALRETVGDGVFETLMAQDGCEDEASQRRLGGHGGVGFLADLLPDRIVNLDFALDSRTLCGGHFELLEQRLAVAAAALCRAPLGGKAAWAIRQSYTMSPFTSR